MQGKGGVNEIVLKNVLSSVWPLETSRESEKMNRLYTEDSKLYAV